MLTVLWIAVLAILVLLYSTGPDGVPVTPHRHLVALLQAQDLRSYPSKGGLGMHRSSIGGQPMKNALTTEEIRWRSYEIHAERGGFQGSDMGELFEAERELPKRYNKRDAECSKKK